MYKLANQTINKGLSLGARITLGVISGLFGVVMLLIAPPTEKAIYFYLFGAFCLFITVACFTKDRIRQFIGSSIGSAIFIMGLVYLVSELVGGIFWSGRRSEPSVFNALMYLLFIGVPGAAYAFKVRFGFPKKPKPLHQTSGEINVRREK
ncbi:MAG: sigma-E processing peptidase SpoIIGA [Desulfotignum sp.]|nr:sigma-E processing peptidase SpoIIGA [Desulfotignum sp.]MCF8088248.1 sigma-E processing peptidase SpoIIGA [Desulfotignum sp.]